MNSAKKTILIVEDSITQVMHLRGLLEEHVNLKIYVAEDGVDGLELAQSIRPDLIILDLQMPRMNGFQVVKALKEEKNTKYIPVILFSSHSEKETQVLGIQLGAVEFIPKDAFADAVLMETMRQMGFFKHPINQ